MSGKKSETSVKIIFRNLNEDLEMATVPKTFETRYADNTFQT